MKTKEWVRSGSHHLITRLVCLLLAVVVWLFVMQEKQPAYDAVYYNVRIEVRGSDTFTGELADAGPYNVRVWGTKSDLLRYSAADVTAYVDIATYSQGDGGTLLSGHTYSMPVQFSLPNGLEVRDEWSVSVHLQEKT